MVSSFWKSFPQLLTHASRSWRRRRGGEEEGEGEEGEEEEEEKEDEELQKGWRSGREIIIHFHSILSSVSPTLLPKKTLSVYVLLITLHFLVWFLSY